MAKTGGHYPAPLAALEAIQKGCNLPLEEGLAAETEKFVPLVGSPVSRNLIAVFFQTTRLAKDTGSADPSVQPRPADSTCAGVADDRYADHVLPGPQPSSGRLVQPFVTASSTSTRS